MPKPRIDIMFPVYAHKAVIGCRPLFYVNKARKLEMIAEGSARSIGVGNRPGRALQLTICLPPGVQKSTTMGPNVVEAIADGRMWALALQAEWQPGEAHR